MITDVLVIAKADKTYAAKLTFESGESTWINDGDLSQRGRIVINQRGHSIKLEMDKEAVSKFKAGITDDLNADKPHHRVVGKASVDDAKFLAFFDTSGTRVSLKPASDDAEHSETTSIADQFA